MSDLVKSTQSSFEVFLPKKYEPFLSNITGSIFEIEHNKNKLRCMLRFDFLISQYVFDSYMLFLKLNRLNKFLFQNFSLPYAIIHAPYDLIEKSPIHFDQVDLFPITTSWFPLQNYLSPPISYVKNYNFFDIMTKRDLKNYQTTDLCPKLGNYYYWSGLLPHSGNLNNSNNVNIAVTSRFTFVKHRWEFGGGTIHNASTFLKDLKIDLSRFNIEFYNNILDIFFDMLCHGNSTDIDKYLIVLRDLCLKDNNLSRYLNFYCSVFVQRLATFNDFEHYKQQGMLNYLYKLANITFQENKAYIKFCKLVN